jgi:hypothetical protein
VSERQKEETARAHAEFLTILAQEDAAMAERVDSLAGMVSEIGTCIPQLMGPQGPGEAVMEFVSAAEQLHADAARVLLQNEAAKKEATHGLMQLLVAGEAKRGFCNAHRAFANWKDFVLQFVMEDKKAFARVGRVDEFGKIASCYRYSAGVGKAELRAKMAEWSE